MSLMSEAEFWKVPKNRVSTWSW